MSPGAYIFQRPFLRGLFLEGLIFEEAYLWREICSSKSIGLALQLKRNLPFLLCITWYLRAIAKYKPPRGGGAYIWRDDLTESFLRYEFGVLRWRGLYTEGLIFGILRYFCERNAGVKKINKQKQIFCSSKAVSLFPVYECERMLGTRLLVSWLFSIPERPLKTF